MFTATLAWAAFVFEGGTAAVAFDVHLKDRGVVDEPVDDGERLAIFAVRVSAGIESRCRAPRRDGICAE